MLLAPVFLRGARPPWYERLTLVCLEYLSASRVLRQGATVCSYFMVEGVAEIVLLYLQVKCIPLTSLLLWSARSFSAWHAYTDSDSRCSSCTLTSSTKEHLERSATDIQRRAGILDDGVERGGGRTERPSKVCLREKRQTTEQQPCF